MTSWVEFLVEELSMEAALRSLIPRLRPDLTSAFAVHPFGGKDDLLSRLPNRLRGYARCLPPDAKVVVVVDRDRDDCRELKERIAQAASSAGLRPKSRMKGRFNLLVRLAIEELEAWYLGDPDALVAAYPRLPSTLGKRARFRDPDAIPHTWRTLEKELQRAGYFREGLAKVELARTVAPRLRPDLNSSASFRVFRDGLLTL